MTTPACPACHHAIHERRCEAAITIGQMLSTCDCDYIGNSAADVITAASLSYRQLDYWTRKRYIRPRRRHYGTGNPRSYSDEELGVAVRMARLVDRGFTPLAASKIARRTPGVVYLGQGVEVTVYDPPSKAGAS